MIKPKYIEEEHLTYLDRLRESGKTNMFGATPFIVEMFPELTREEALGILIFWMRSFKERHISD